MNKIEVSFWGFWIRFEDKEGCSIEMGKASLNSISLN